MLPLFRQFYNMEAGEKMCLQRPDLAVPPIVPSEPLVLAQCREYGRYEADTQVRGTAVIWVIHR